MLSAGIINITEEQAKGRACDTLARDAIDGIKADLRFGTIPRHLFTSLHRLNLLNFHRDRHELVITRPGDEPIDGGMRFIMAVPQESQTKGTFEDSYRFESLGTVQQGWVYRTGSRGYIAHSEGLTYIRTAECCSESIHYIVCACKTLEPLSNTSKVMVNILPLREAFKAMQVGPTQWCFTTPETEIIAGSLLCGSSHRFCLQVTDSLTVGEFHLLGSTSGYLFGAWWDDCLYIDKALGSIIHEAMKRVTELTQNYTRQSAEQTSKGTIQENLALQTAIKIGLSGAHHWWDIFGGGCSAGIWETVRLGISLGTCAVLIWATVMCCNQRKAGERPIAPQYIPMAFARDGGGEEKGVAGIYSHVV
ncbi:uncharacterized protein [Scyliorhinus torazame]|uniref:uncharacterized protein isoform X1 n=1 Tax=Scyliorhinus torazame TaxID=75743 RepID=UPI003B5CE6C8